MTEVSKLNVPLPRVDEESKGFWEACGREELYIQKCGDCGRLRHYPRALCPDCLSSEVRWLVCSGNATVAAFTVVYQNQSPGFRERVPYVLAHVELAEGVLFLTNIVDADVEAVRIGMPVKVVFKETEQGMKIPFFAPRKKKTRRSKERQRESGPSTKTPGTVSLPSL